ncbi:MAG: aminopeptidase P family protein [Pseudomonadota bacterium]
MNSADKVAALRRQMKTAGVSAYYVPSSDPHQSEYVPSCWQRRQWVSGFTGSAGDVLIGLKKAGLWTDGRYFIQAEEQLAGSGIDLFRMGDSGVPTLDQHITQSFTKRDTLGVDPSVVPIKRLAQLESAVAAAGASIKMLSGNLVDAIWNDRPPVSDQPVMSLPVKFAGESVSQKLKRVRASLAERGTNALVVSTLDSIAWLFNIRGADVSYNPVAIAYAIVDTQGASLFIDDAKLAAKTIRGFGKSVSVHPYDALGKALHRLGTKGERVWIDSDTLNAWARGQLEGAQLTEAPNPIERMKARKNATELTGIRNAHVRDGVAVSRFLRWLDEEVSGGEVTEISAADQLESFRREGDNFRGLSFPTISGYAHHGAIIHYSVDEASNIRLRPKGLYLVDSGAQYLDGTTDITRTVLLGGRATKHQKSCFTRVLKGHIALATSRFPAGASGARLDSFARRALWDVGLDYGHGTGHGVGAFLNVHEGPQSISHGRGLAFALEVGNVQSNEPGYYEPGQFGIRTENLIEVVRDDKLSAGGREFLRFDTLTLAPIDRRLIDIKLLNQEELSWVDEYHQRVRRTLSKHLGAADRRWLREATAPLR